MTWSAEWFAIVMQTAAIAVLLAAVVSLWRTNRQTLNLCTKLHDSLLASRRDRLEEGRRLVEAVGPVVNQLTVVGLRLPRSEVDDDLVGRVNDARSRLQALIQTVSRQQLDVVQATPPLGTSRDQLCPSGSSAGPTPS